jgi:hypothetical protein
MTGESAGNGCRACTAVRDVDEGERERGRGWAGASFVLRSSYHRRRRFQSHLLRPSPFPTSDRSRFRDVRNRRGTWSRRPHRLVSPASIVARPATRARAHLLVRHGSHHRYSPSISACSSDPTPYMRHSARAILSPASMSGGRPELALFRSKPFAYRHYSARRAREAQFISCASARAPRSTSRPRAPPSCPPRSSSPGGAAARGGARASACPRRPCARAPSRPTVTRNRTRTRTSPGLQARGTSLEEQVSICSVLLLMRIIVHSTRPKRARRAFGCEAGAHFRRARNLVTSASTPAPAPAFILFLRRSLNAADPLLFPGPLPSCRVTASASSLPVASPPARAVQVHGNVPAAHLLVGSLPPRN